MTIFWLQQYAAEKERADIAESAYQGLAESAVTRGEYESLLDKHTAMTKAYRAEKERADKAEERHLAASRDRDAAYKAYRESEAREKKLV